MKRHEILRHALNLCVREEDSIYGEKTPFYNNGWAVATSGYCILWIKDKQIIPGLPSDIRDTLKVRKNFYKSDLPGTGILYHYKNLGSITRDWLIFHQIPECKFVQIGDIKIPYERWKQMELVMEFLGLDGWDVDQPEGTMNALTFNHGNIDMDDNAYCLLVMGTESKEPATVITLEKGYRNLENPDDSRNRRYGIDEQQASLFITQWQETQQRKAEELRAKRLGNLWEVMVAKYAYMYVEAADEEEAKKLAKKHYDDADEEIFNDSDWDLEGVQGQEDIDNLSDELADDLTIYTIDDGMMSKNDYIKKMKQAGAYEEEDEE